MFSVLSGYVFQYEHDGFFYDYGASYAVVRFAIEGMWKDDSDEHI